MVQQRLPIVNGDDGAWGDILNQYLQKEHYNTGSDNTLNGGHKTVTIRPGTTAAGTAPLKFTSGPLMTTPEPGAIEFYNDRLYFTNTTNATRDTIASFDDSVGATGDLYYRNASGDFVRLPVGSSAQILTVNGGIPAWTTPAGSGARITSNVSSNVTADAATNTDYVYYATGAVTITLPTASGNTNMYTVKNVGTATVTVATTSSQTIDGSTTVTLPISNMALDFVSNGSNWMVQ